MYLTIVDYVRPGLARVLPVTEYADGVRDNRTMLAIINTFARTGQTLRFQQAYQFVADLPNNDGFVHWKQA